jgi:hypothetical protein
MAVAIDILNTLALSLMVIALAMRTMMVLRIIMIVASAAFIAYALLAQDWPVLIAHLLLLPLNVWRLAEMQRLVHAARRATGVPLGVDWLLPYMRTLELPEGHVLFRRGDIADGIYFVADGRLQLEESGLELGRGALFGEIGIFSDDHRRTATVKTMTPTSLLQISAEKVRELYYQNPRFGFYLVGLITQRLMQNADGNDPEAVAAGEHTPTTHSA